ncbi:MAG TPA: universal stress protein [Tepidiformaceae bacterium]
MRLLVCLDRTTFAQSILPVAQRFAAATNAEVELITVVAPNRHHGEPWSGQQPEPLDAAVVEEAQRDLASIASGFAPPARVTVVVGQSAADAIVRHARATRPDVIVLATHSRGRLGEAALGSTASEVTLAGVAPVLLLHPVGAIGMRTGDIPIGVYAFTADGEQLGTVAEVTPDRLRIRSSSGDDVWLPASVAGAITTGRLVLEMASTDLARLAQQARG